jgi:hypothetical protein
MKPTQRPRPSGTTEAKRPGRNDGLSGSARPRSSALGHWVGDRFLADAAHRIAAHAREDDVAAGSAADASRPGLRHVEPWRPSSPAQRPWRWTRWRAGHAGRQPAHTGRLESVLYRSGRSGRHGGPGPRGRRAVFAAAVDVADAVALRRAGERAMPRPRRPWWPRRRSAVVLLLSGRGSGSNMRSAGR